MAKPTNRFRGAALSVALVCCAATARAEQPSAISAANASASWGLVRDAFGPSPGETSGGGVGQLGGGGGGGGANRFAHFRVEVHLDFGWYSAAGAGVRFEFPLAPRGILDGVDDEIALSVGAELFYFYWADAVVGLGVYPIVALQWNFYVGSNVSLFPELGVAFLFGPSRDRYWGAWAAPFFGLGLRVHFNARNALLFRVSWPAGLQLGVTF